MAKPIDMPLRSHLSMKASSKPVKAQTNAGHSVALDAMLFLYLLMEYVRPHEIVGAPAFGIPMILGILLAVMWLRRGDRAVLKDPIMKGAFAFVGVMILTVVVVLNHFHWLTNTKAVLICIVGLALPITAFYSTEPRLSRLIRTFVAMNLIVAAYSLANAGKGPGGGFIADENDVCIALIVALPYTWFLSQSPGLSAWKKWFYLLASGLLVIAIVNTNSRGGFLGFAAVALGIFAYAPNKARNALVGVLFAAVIASFIPASYWTEMESITDTEDSTRNERIYSWRRSFEMFVDHPLIGVGVANWGNHVAAYEIASGEFDIRTARLLAGRVSHSLYFTLLPETGLAGTVIYLALLWMMFRRLQRVSARVRKRATDPQCMNLFLLSRAMLLSLLGYLVAGTFVSVLYYPHLWILIGFVIALDRAASACCAEPGPERREPRTVAKAF